MHGDKRISELNNDSLSVSTDSSTSALDAALVLAEQAKKRSMELEKTLTRYLRRPWRPLTDCLARYFALLAAFCAEPFSQKRAVKFRLSAAKRDPRRFQQKEDMFATQKTGLSSRDAVLMHRPLHSWLGSGIIVQKLLKKEFRPAASSYNNIPLGFAFVTPCVSRKHFFLRCAESLNELLQFEREHSGTAPIEWIVVCGDSPCSDTLFRERVPMDVRQHLRVLSEIQSDGYIAALNRGIREAKHPWIIVLDENDQIEPNALDVLTRAITSKPHCRCFCSGRIDVDENDVELRRLFFDVKSFMAFGDGIFQGHLLAFRYDLFNELDGFDHRFLGVHDYDFLLRASCRDRLGELPDYLYRYCCEQSGVSAEQKDRKSLLTSAVQVTFLRQSLGLQYARVSRSALPNNPTGICVIRTQGKRMELLEAALASVRAQNARITPCVVVHGDAATFDFVAGHLPEELCKEGGPGAVLLHAPDVMKRRGYPGNVALEHIRENRDRYDLLCFLDDDDHILPNFFNRLSQLIRLAEADFAYGLSNALPVAGEPFLQHNLMPSVALFDGNFITVNSFLVRTDVLMALGVTFDEHIHYLEDWDFLVQLVAGKAKGVPFFEAVSEYRLTGDGNTENKLDQKHFKYCVDTVQKRAQDAVKNLSQRVFWADVLNFPFDRREPLSLHEIARLERVRDMLSPIV